MSRKDYNPLEADSVIDCALIEQTTFTKSYLLERASKKQIQPLEPLSPTLLKAILLAVQSAKLLSPRLKALILADEEESGVFPQ